MDGYLKQQTTPDTFHESVKNQLTNLTGIQFVVEKHASNGRYVVRMVE